MSIRDKFFEDKAVGALWDVAVSIKRGNPLPLDSTSVFESVAALEAYLNDKSTIAYPGQVVAVVGKDGDAEFTKIYYIDHELVYHEVGKEVDLTNYATKEDLANAIAEATPKADERTIENNNGVLGLANVDDLTFENVSTYNIVIKKNDDGKAYVDYQIPSATTVEGLDTRLTAAEDAIDDLEEAVGKPSGDTNSASGLFKAIEDEVTRSVTADQHFGTRLKNIESFVGGLTNPLQFLGVSYYEPTGPVVTLVDGSSTAAKSGDVVLYGDKEYIYDGANWALFGDAGDLVTHSELQQAVESLEGNIKQANWNQEDVNASDYIIGRTHYEYTTYATSPIDSTDEDTFIDFIDDEKGICQVIINNDGVKRNAVYSEDPLDRYVHIWTVNVDGTTYTCKYDSDENFELITEPAATWAFYPKAGTKVQQLDPKYVDAYTKAEADAKFIDENELAEAIGNIKIPEIPEYVDTNTEYELTLAEDGLTVQLTSNIPGALPGDSGKAKIDTYTKKEIDDKISEIDAKIPPEVGEDNIIEIIKVNGEALPVKDKTVEILLATADKAGVVKSSTAENNVKVNDDGTMTVNNINVNKLVQTEYIILNGGNAALDFPIENN